MTAAAAREGVVSLSCFFLLSVSLRILVRGVSKKFYTCLPLIGWLLTSPKIFFSPRNSQRPTLTTPIMLPIPVPSND